MRMLGIVMMRTLRRLGVELQSRIIQFFVSDFAGVETRHRVLAHHAKELASRLFTGPRFIFEAQGFQ